jgi:hypothetical protein
MAYALLRTVKLKQIQEIASSLSHTFRTRDTPNADPDRADQNEHFGPATPDEILAAITAKLPAKRRSDAVLCIEYFIGASPGHRWPVGDEEFFKDSIAWLAERHGEENVVSSHIHRDETTPHLVAYVVPLDGDKLNAKKWLGGKQKLSQMQSHFAENVGERHGLERGIEGSRASHVTIKEFYARAHAAEMDLETIQTSKERLVVEKGLFSSTVESDRVFAERIASEVKEQLKPTVLKAAQLPLVQRREREQATENMRLRAEVADWRELTKGLSLEDRGRLLSFAKHKARELRQAAQHVIGWFRGFTRQGVTAVDDRESGLRREITGSQVQQTLKADGVSPGDLIEVRGSSARILERAADRRQDHGRGWER